MQIEKAINKWFENTQKLITEVSLTDKSNSLSFCAVAVLVMKRYCCATALLLDKGFKLPAMALMRCISDFFIKFLWSIDTNDENEIRNRLQRWDKTADAKKLKLYQSLLKLEGVLSKEDFEKAKESKEKVERNYNSNTAKKMPNVTGENGLFGSTSNIFGGDVSAVLYSQFCSAVHIDAHILTGLKQEGAGQVLEINDDINENLNNLKMRCLNFSYMFLLSVHKTKNWRMEAIEREYKTIIGDFSMND